MLLSRKNLKSAGFQPIHWFGRTIEVPKPIHDSEESGRDRLRQSYDRIGRAFQCGRAIELGCISGPDKCPALSVVRHHRVERIVDHAAGMIWPDRKSDV